MQILPLVMSLLISILLLGFFVGYYFGQCSVLDWLTQKGFDGLREAFEECSL